MGREGDSRKTFISIMLHSKFTFVKNLPTLQPLSTQISVANESLIIVFWFSARALKLDLSLKETLDGLAC